MERVMLLSIAQESPLNAQTTITMRKALSAMEVEVAATEVAVDLGQNGVVLSGDQQHCQLHQHAPVWTVFARASTAPPLRRPGCTLGWRGWPTSTWSG